MSIPAPLVRICACGLQFETKGDLLRHAYFVHNRVATRQELMRR